MKTISQWSQKKSAMLMRVPKKEYDTFLEALGNLELNLKIQKNRKNKYRLVEKTYYEGIYRKNQKGFGFVRIGDTDEEIYIAKGNEMQALNGDRVLVEMTEEENKIKKAEGIVAKILNMKKTQ